MSDLVTTLTPRQVADLIHVHPRTLANWRSLSDERHQVGPPYVKQGRRVLYPVAKLRMWQRYAYQPRVGTLPGD